MDAGGAAESDLAAEGIDAAEIAQSARRGGANTEDGKGFRTDGDTATQLEGRAVRHGRASTQAAQGSRVGDRQRTSGDSGEPRVGVSASEQDGTTAEDGDGA